MENYIKPIKEVMGDQGTIGQAHWLINWTTKTCYISDINGELLKEVSISELSYICLSAETLRILSMRYAQGKISADEVGKVMLCIINQINDQDSAKETAQEFESDNPRVIWLYNAFCDFINAKLAEMCSKTIDRLKKAAKAAAEKQRKRMAQAPPHTYVPEPEFIIEDDDDDPDYPY